MGTPEVLGATSQCCWCHCHSRGHWGLARWLVRKLPQAALEAGCIMGRGPALAFPSYGAQ